MNKDVVLSSIGMQSIYMDATNVVNGTNYFVFKGRFLRFTFAQFLSKELLHFDIELVIMNLFESIFYILYVITTNNMLEKRNMQKGQILRFTSIITL